MSKIDDVIAAAMGQIGTPYSFGAEQPGKAFDCSGLIQWAFGHAGVGIPRTSQEQQAATTRVTNPLPGDLVFYGQPAEHVGLYLGDGKMIDAADYGQPVQVRPVWGSPTYGRVSGVGTALASALSPVSSAASDAAAKVLQATGILGGARNLVLEGIAVALGVGLVGYGVWRSVSPSTRNTLTGGAS